MLEIIANRYMVERELGKGGMAVVYRAFDKHLKRAVALKIMHAHLASNNESSLRFVSEAKSVAKLNHVNIVRIYDADYDEAVGCHFIVMELIEGPTLTDFCAKNPILVPEIGVSLVASLCDALHHAHENGIVHRDIKPDNIMIDSDGRVMLMDFGIARCLDSTMVTASGCMLGSPAHMAPEIIEGKPYHSTCDIFSLGTVLYYVLTGRLPFEGETAMSVFYAILEGRYINPSEHNQAISKKLAGVIERSLLRDPEKRYPDVPAMKAAMLDALSEIPIGDCAKNFARYYKASEEERNMIRSEYAKQYIDIAKRALERSALPKAVDYVNRALFLEPENREAKYCLKRAGKKRIFRFSVLTLLLLGSLGAAFFHYMPVPSKKDIDVSKQSDIIVGEQISKSILPSYSHIRSNFMKMGHWGDFFPNNIRPFFFTNLPSEEKSDVENAQETLVAQNMPSKTTPEPHARSKGTRENRAEHQRSDREQNKQVGGQNGVNKKNGGNKNTILVDKVANESAPAPGVPMTQVTIPVFPADAFAIFEGKSTGANSDGDIILKLKPGKHNITINCNRRCKAKKVPVIVPAGEKSIRTEFIELAWADASLRVISQSGTYAIARSLDSQGDILHLSRNAPRKISGFTRLGRPLKFEIYAIPNDSQLSGYDVASLEKVKVASTRISIAPGEEKRINL